MVLTEIHIGDFRCDLIRYCDEEGPRDPFQIVEHVLRIPLAYCEQGIESLQNLINSGITDESGHYLTNLTIQVIDGDNVLFESLPYILNHRFATYRRGVRAADLDTQLSSLKKRFDEIPGDRKPYGRLAEDLMYQLSIHLMAYRDGWQANRHFQSAQGLLRRIEREIDRLAAGDPVEIAVECLFAQVDRGSVHNRNLQTVTAINAASVRTGGFVEPFTEEAMVRFYRDTLSKFDNPLVSLDDAALRLDINDYAPADLLEDPELEVAPLQVAFESNKGQTMHNVTYRFVDDEPTAIVRLSLRTFRRHEPEYGKSSRFPKLPHDIVWAVEVECDSKVIARGKADLDLVQKIGKWEKGKRRAKHAEAPLSIGSDLYGTEVSEAPPWFQGRTNRRK